MTAQLRFGSYELDVAGMELRKNGVRVHLPDQPFRILATLVSKPGEVVTREELRSRIWEDGTFVDFDQSLNKAVNRLREVLNDDASRPRFIETVPRRGYRFVAHVTGPAPSAVEPPPAGLRPWTSPERHRPNRLLAFGCGALAISGALIFFLYSAHTKQEHLGVTPRLLIADAFSPKLSRDGKLLAYMSTGFGDVPHIWMRQIGGQNAIQRGHRSTGKRSRWLCGSFHPWRLSGRCRRRPSPLLAARHLPTLEWPFRRPLLSPFSIPWHLSCREPHGR
jgi:DNA-binding winged helix-turn-helix (wHTH) protein